MGGHYIKCWSKTQSLVVVSSAEPEVNDILKATKEGL